MGDKKACHTCNCQRSYGLFRKGRRIREQQDVRFKVQSKALRSDRKDCQVNDSDHRS